MASRIACWSLCCMLAVGGTSAACSFLGDFSTEQCSTDDDCAALGLAGYRCGAERVCLAPSAGQGGGAQGCQSNAECTALNQDVPHVCNPDTSQCVRLQDDEHCKVLAGDGAWTADNLIIMGVFAPLEPSAPSDSQAALAVKLAVNEINLAGGMPGEGESSRLLLAVVCDQSDPDSIVASADRLIDEVGADMIIGELSTPQLQSLMLGPAKNTLVLATRSLDASVRGAAFKDNGLLWHMVGDITELAPAYAAALLEAEAQARALGATGDIRVASVTQFSFAYEQLAESTRPLLKFNGDQAVMQGNPNYSEAVIPLPVAGQQTDYHNATIVPLDAFAPHVIVDLTDGELVERVLFDLEAAWSHAHRPVYVGSHASRYSQLLFAPPPFVPNLAERFLGVEWHTDATLFEKLKSDIPSAFPFAKPDETAGYNILYDAIYVGAYASYLTFDVTQLNGDRLKEHIVNLDSGEVVFVGTTGTQGKTFVDGLQLLSTQGELHFHGTSGPLGWNDADGARVGLATGTFCLEPRPQEPVLFRYRFGAQAYDPVSMELTGTGCF